MDKLFESDIKLTPEDHDRVDTSQTGDAEGADVEVQSIERGEKRKAIRTRRKIWPSRRIPVTLTVCELKRENEGTKRGKKWAENGGPKRGPKKEVPKEGR